MERFRIDGSIHEKRIDDSGICQSLARLVRVKDLLTPRFLLQWIVWMDQ